MRGFTLLGKEFTEIIKNKKILIPIIGILFIPILYAGMFLWAFWDPYERLNDLPVAIVNEDKGAVLEGEEMNGGEDLVANLKDNKSFKWEFVDEKTAKKGMEDRKYYMLIRIPEDFSSNATTLLTDNPTPSSLEYIPNESLNFLSSQIGASAVEHIKSEVSSEITKTYAETMFASVEEVSQGFTDAADGANQLHDGTVQLEDGSRKVTDGLNTLQEKSGEMKTGVSKLLDGSNQVTGGLNTLLAESGKLKQGTADLATGMNKLTAGQSELATGAKGIQAGIHTINSELAASKTTLDGMGAKLANLQESAGKVNALNEGAKATAQSTQKAVNDVAALQQAIASLPQEYQEQLKPLINNVQTSVGAAGQQSAGVAAGTNQLQGAFSSLQTGLPDTQKLTKLTTGLAQLEEGQNKFVKGLDEFGVGLNEAKTGVETLAKGTEPLITGVTKLADGSKQVSAGLGTMSAGSDQLVSGVNELANGSNQITNGLGEVNGGTTELATKLGEGAEKTGEVKGTDETYNMFADPVKVKTEKIKEVPNYGTGFTPYFLSLGLFVGALLLSIVYPLRDTVGVPKSGFSWFISKFGVLLAVGIIQALVADIILMLGLGVEVQSVPYFILFSILTSLAFIALIQCLVTAFGDTGRFIAIITLILQLTTSAGTFPLELIPEFLQHFNAWLPMTYSVSGFKAIVSSGDFSFMWQNAGILVIFIVLLSVGTIASLTWMHKRQFGKFTEEA